MLAWSLIEAQAYTLRRDTVPVLPTGSPDVRVLHISDLHLRPSQRRKIAWVRDLADLEPDLVVNTGDNMAHLDAMPAVLEALAPLLTVPGAFVTGSNDYYAPALKNPVRYLIPHGRQRGSDGPVAPRLPGEELAEAFAAAGWKDLGNKRATLSAGGVTFSLVGTDDAHMKRDHFPAPSQEATPAADGSDAVVRLGVTHAPYRRVLNRMRTDGCAMVFAGHTHGGQLCVPGHGALVTNCDLDPGRASGLHGWPGARPDDGGATSIWLQVSAGLGTSPFTPVRFACRPEATLLTLTARHPA